MARIVIISLLVLLASASFAQDGYKTKFGVGLTLGLNTPVGMGAELIYTPWNFLHIDAGIGKTAFNGFKYAGGLRIFPLKKKQFNPYLGGYYSRTTGQTVRSQNGLSTELYKTYANHYAHPHLGFTLLGEQMNHTFALGYSIPLNDYNIFADLDNKTFVNQEKIESKLGGGFMATYTIWMNFRMRR